MKKQWPTIAVVAFLFLVGYYMDEGKDPNSWAYLFWMSALGNVALLFLFLEAMDKLVKK